MKIGIAVKCSSCGRTKAPIGRSVASLMFDSLCNPHDCEGFRKPPFPGSLWPGETEADFGYPVGCDATREQTAAEVEAIEVEMRADAEWEARQQMERPDDRCPPRE